MQLSRRQSIALLVSTVPFGVAGCTELGSSTEGPKPYDDEDIPPSDDAEGSANIDLNVVVSGPDGEQPFFDTDDIRRVGSVDDRDQSGYLLPITLTDDGTTNAIEAFRTVGAADPEEATITHTIEGDVNGERTFDVAPALADVIASGNWDGEFNLVFSDRDAATTVRDALADE